MKNYTPSPWKTEVIDTINGEPGYWHIVQQSTKGVIGDVQSVNFSDAQLIAAAPDLLEVLQEVADFWAGGDVPPELDAKMRDVIKRATQ